MFFEHEPCQCWLTQLVHLTKNPLSLPSESWVRMRSLLCAVLRASGDLDFAFLHTNTLFTKLASQSLFKMLFAAWCQGNI